MTQRNLIHNIIATLQPMLYGFGLAFVAGGTIGTVLGRSHYWRQGLGTSGCDCVHDATPVCRGLVQTYQAFNDDTRVWLTS